MADKAWAILLGGGSSQRFGRDKLREDLGGIHAYQHAIRTFSDHPEIQGIVVVAPDDLAVPGHMLRAEPGADRPGSVRNGLARVPADAHFVLVHDLARPLVSDALIDRVLAALRAGATAVGCAMPVSDTVRRGQELMDRAELMAMQTPQGSTRQALAEAHAQFPGESFTDDLEYLRRAGHEITLVPGESANLKLTTPDDMTQLRSHFPTVTRTGFGYDVHAFSTDASRPLRLGGRLFPGERGLEGHSDADALLHAVVDAILGAASLGDIGMHYPNTDPRWKDRASIEFLRESAAMLRSEGWTLVNIDATVLAEAPKILPHRLEICGLIAEACDIPADCVSLKATTHEGIGAIGRREGIAAMAVATICR
ncbi:MAG: 2-C-methyl-D-erythritol 2,4-cyclodiphosphate synthase [Chthonomonas sp.]|nr:2-C-methyl-D-erythritol 2,4-cyclodiphosphate synthase [Chthonomonas sp.]